jgi:hypothetical protein
MVIDTPAIVALFFNEANATAIAQWTEVQRSQKKDDMARRLYRRHLW